MGPRAKPPGKKEAIDLTQEDEDDDDEAGRKKLDIGAAAADEAGPSGQLVSLIPLVV